MASHMATKQQLLQATMEVPQVCTVMSMFHRQTWRELCDIKKFLVVEVLACLVQNIMMMNVEFREVCVAVAGCSDQRFL